MCVCVCVYTHTHTHTRTRARTHTHMCRHLVTDHLLPLGGRQDASRTSLGPVSPVRSVSKYEKDSHRWDGADNPHFKVWRRFKPSTSRAMRCCLPASSRPRPARASSAPAPLSRAMASDPRPMRTCFACRQRVANALPSRFAHVLSVLSFLRMHSTLPFLRMRA